MSERTGARVDVAAGILPHVLAAEEYTPILPLDVLSEEIGLPVEALVKVDANENPYGPSPRVLEALSTCREYNIYPDPEHRHLRDALATYTGVPASRIVCGNGADELIDLLYRMFVAPGDRVIDCVPTFGMYKFSADVAGADYVAVKRTADFSVDLEGIMAAVNSRTKLIWVASPNNPTGTPLSEADARALLDLGVPVVVDEAYAEFAGGTLLPLTAEFEHLMILRTFSKWAGLAGLRIGYGVFAPAVVAQLLKIKPPYNVSVAGLVGAEAALADNGYRVETVRKIRDERDRLFSLLQTVPYLTPVPSEANFVFSWVTRGNAREIRDTLRARGILVRHYSNELLRNGIRVSAGTPEQTDRVIAALRAIKP